MFFSFLAFSSSHLPLSVLIVCMTDKCFYLCSDILPCLFFWDVKKGQFFLLNISLSFLTGELVIYHVSETSGVVGQP